MKCKFDETRHVKTSSSAHPGVYALLNICDYDDDDDSIVGDGRLET